ncbi:DUF3105 domain-containing protein [Deinococcus sp. UYEF24]
MKRLCALILPALLIACASGRISGVKVFANQGSHVTGRVDYPQEPPAGGAHNPEWQNCGTYDRQLYNEYAVHSLEHGAVWILYREGIAVDQVQQLQEAIVGQPRTLLSPSPDLRSPVVMVAWNAQLDLDSTTDPRLLKFILKYVQGGAAPEQGAPCSGGSGETL